MSGVKLPDVNFSAAAEKSSMVTEVIITDAQNGEAGKLGEFHSLVMP